MRTVGYAWKAKERNTDFQKQMSKNNILPEHNNRPVGNNMQISSSLLLQVSSLLRRLAIISIIRIFAARNSLMELSMSFSEFPQSGHPSSSNASHTLRY